MPDPTDVLTALRRAISDPGHITPRAETEGMPNWQARAALTTLATVLSRDVLVQALATVDGNQRSPWGLLDRLYGPLAEGVLALLAPHEADSAGSSPNVALEWGLAAAGHTAPHLYTDEPEARRLAAAVPQWHAVCRTVTPWAPAPIREERG